MSCFVAALQFLTLFPWPRRAERAASEIASGAIFFPVIGALLGVVLSAADLAFFPIAGPSLSSVVLVALLAMLTRGLHLDGLADTFDGFGAGGDRERILRVMDDSRIGAFGVIVIVLVLFFKVHAIANIETARWRTLLAAPVLSRWAMLVLGYRSQAAKAGLGSALVASLSTSHFLIATAATLLLTAAILHITGTVIMAAIYLFALASRSFFHRRLGGVTGDTFGAVGELSEASVLVFLAMMSR
jgi:adenosylcobinamide-GDP ribazoletransferase